MSTFKDYAAEAFLPVTFVTSAAGERYRGAAAATAPQQVLGSTHKHTKRRDKKMPFNFPSFGRRTSSNNTFSTPATSEPATPIPQTQTRRGLLQKQKATLHWAERFCWIEAGEFRWAEPSRDDSRMRGRERGGVNCADIHEARRITGDSERPHRLL